MDVAGRSGRSRDYHMYEARKIGRGSLGAFTVALTHVNWRDAVHDICASLEGVEAVDTLTGHIASNGSRILCARLSLSITLLLKDYSLFQR